MELAEMLSVLWRTKWIILVTAVVAASIVAASEFRSESTYEAEALLVVGNLGTTEPTGREDELAQTYAKLVNTEGVLAEAAAEYGSGATAKNMGAVSSETSEEGTYITLRYTSDDSQEAIDKVNAVARGLVAYVDNAKDENFEGDRKRILNELVDVESELAQLEANPVPDEGRRNALNNVRQTLIRSYEELTVQGLSSNNLTIVNMASSSVKDANHPWRNTIVAFIIGAIIGAAIGFAVDTVRKALRGAAYMA